MTITKREGHSAPGQARLRPGQEIGWPPESRRAPGAA